LLPPALRPQRLAEIQAGLIAELNPATSLESMIVAGLAGHFAMLEVAGEAEPAVLRQGAHNLSALAFGAAQDPEEQHDAVLSASVSTDALERLTRYRRAHEKGMKQSLDILLQLRQRIPNAAPDDRPSALDMFANSAACEQYLQARFSAPGWRCPRCGHVRGSWIAGRKRWECNGCGHQTGLRGGTLMEGSALPLSAWFRAVILLVQRPAAAISELRRVTGVERPATVRRMRTKILAALEDPERKSLLTGIDEVASPADN
jgi:transposase-like protein